MWPFDYLIQRRKMNVQIIMRTQFKFWMKADWEMYELILFNIIQNSVKYVKYNDDNIIIVLTCKPMRKEITNNNNH